MTAGAAKRPEHFRDERTYRSRMKAENLVRFDVRVYETDLCILAEKDLTKLALAKVVDLRNDLTRYADVHEDFYGSLAPLEAADGAPEVVGRMCRAAAAWEVGPMAAVAGTFAEMVGEALLEKSAEVIVENGGDIFIAARRPREVEIYSGAGSPWAGRLSVRIAPESGIRGVCTSSGTIGHSFSRGKADAVAAFAESAAFADAAATAVGNRVKSAADVERIVDEEKRRGALKGLVIVAGPTMGAFGEVEFVE